MKEFFRNENPVFLFKQFGLIHNIFIISAVIALLLIYINRKKISKIPQQTTWKILKIGAIILLLNMIIYTVGNLYYGSFDINKHLPFHLCFIANYMFAFAILFKKENILRITLFMSFIGPIPAILWPDLVSTIDNYDFWQYIISHHVFINMSLFSYYALQYKITKKDYIKTFFLANILMLIMIPFNLIFDTNYIFSSKIPDNVTTLYPFLGSFPPLLVLEITGLIISILVYKFIVIKDKKA